MIRLDLDITKGAFSGHFKAELPVAGVSALFGESGSGKSSIVRALAGLDKPDGSTICFNQQCWLDANVFVKPEARCIAYVAQKTILFEHLNVLENLEYAERRAPITNSLGTRHVRFNLDELAQRFEIEHLLGHSPKQLSGGERQRVALVRAFLRTPQLMLLDEPFSGLDQQLKRRLMQQVVELTKGLRLPVVLVTHSIDEVSFISDHLLLVKDGRIDAGGTTPDLLTRLDLPFAHDANARALINAEIVEHDDHYNLTYLECAAGRFSVLRQNLPVGSVARLAFAARDVSLALQIDESSSILNKVDAEIIDMKPSGLGQAIVLLKSHGQLFLSRITNKSADHMRLLNGSRVIVQAKSIALV